MASTPDRKLVVFLIDSLTGGGAERVICQVASSLDPAIYQAKIVLTLGDAKDVSPADHVETSILSEIDNLNRGFMRKAWDVILAGLTMSYVIWASKAFGDLRSGRLADLLRDIGLYRRRAETLSHYFIKHRPDCVISFLPNSNLIGLLASQKLDRPVPVACSDRNFLSSELARLQWPGVRHWLVSRIYNTAAVHVAVTEPCGVDLAENFGISKDHVTTIMNGVDLPRLETLAMQPNGQTRNMSIVQLIAVGRLSEQKAFELLLNALAKVRSNNWELLILGEGEEREALENLSLKLELTDRIRFEGWQKNPYSWMNKADVFIMSSRWEGMPNALLEAMAIGLPVIATDCPTGPSILLDNGRAGVLVENENVSALTEAIQTLVIDKTERDRLAVLAKAEAQKHSVEETNLKFRSLIESLVK